MNQLTKVFNGQQVRIIEKNGDPWFVARDVCNILEIKNPTDALKRLDEDERARFNLGRQGVTNVVNEFGLYNLVLGSRKPEAKEFKRWITHEVIPSIRKTGSYSMIDTSQLSPELQIMNNMVRALANQELANKQMKEELHEVKQDVTDVRNIFTINPKSWRKEVNDLIIKISRTKNNLDAYRDTRNESYKRLEDRARCNLDIRLQNMRDRMKRAGASQTAINRKNKMDVIESDTRLMEIYLTVVKEMAIKHRIKSSKSKEAI